MLEIVYPGGCLSYRATTIGAGKPDVSPESLTKLLREKRLLPAHIEELSASPESLFYSDMNWQIKEACWEYVRSTYGEGAAKLLSDLCTHTLPDQREVFAERVNSTAELYDVLAESRDGLLASKSFAKSKTLARLRERAEAVLRKYQYQH